MLNTVLDKNFSILSVTSKLLTRPLILLHFLSFTDLMKSI